MNAARSTRRAVLRAIAATVVCSACSPSSVENEQPPAQGSEASVRRAATRTEVNGVGYLEAEFDGGIVMVQIPAGPFTMGRTGEPDAEPEREVTLDAFWMAQFPVTVGQFRAFVEATGYRTDAERGAGAWQWNGESPDRVDAKGDVWEPMADGRWNNIYFEQADDHPVGSVSWNDADAYCAWLAERFGLPFVLPTEAQWEKAARGDDGRIYPWGDEAPTPAHANLDGYALGCVDVADHEAGDNFWGCRQLIGNVWEWTSDVFGPFAEFAPDDYREYSEPLFGSTKVLRGGAWTTRARLASGLYRNYFGPDRRDVLAGFRTCARD